MGSASTLLASAPLSGDRDSLEVLELGRVLVNLNRLGLDLDLGHLKINRA